MSKCHIVGNLMHWLNCGCMMAADQILNTSRNLLRIVHTEGSDVILDLVRYRFPGDSVLEVIRDFPRHKTKLNLHIYYNEMHELYSNGYLRPLTAHQTRKHRYFKSK